MIDALLWKNPLYVKYRLRVARGGSPTQEEPVGNGGAMEMPPGVADPAFRSPKNGTNKPTSMDKEPVKRSSLLSITWHSVVLKEWTVPTCSQGRSRTPSPNFGDNLVGNSFQGRRLPSSFTQRQGSRSVSACFNFCVRNAVCSGIKHTCCKIATTLSECYNFCIGKPA